MGELFRRLHYLFHRRRLDRELNDDMQFHREMMAADRRRSFGNTLLLREQAQQAWGWTWLVQLAQDLRYAARMLLRSPGFTLTAVLVLAIGIGVNLTAFSLFNMIALKPLPVRDPATLVQLQRRSSENINATMPYPTVVFFGQHARSLAAVIAVMGTPPMHLDDTIEPLPASFATANYFRELGTQPALGRLFDPARDDDPAAPPAAVLSYNAWQRRFGADPSILGRTIYLNKRAVTVVGVTSESFASLGGQRPDVWLPLQQQPYFIEGSKILSDSSVSSVSMWARLAPGVSAKAAELELLALTNELRRLHPKEIWDNEYIHSDPGGYLQIMRPEMYQVAAMIAVLTLLILAVACTNLGGLLLARGITREHEISIRVAVGASRVRIFRQLFTESLFLAGLGSAAGIALSFLVLRVTLVAIDAPKWVKPVPDWRILLFAVGIGLLAAIVFGLAPALQIARQRQRRPVARQVLVAAQIAASCILLIVAGLLVRAVHHTLYTSPGFGYQQTFSVDPQLGQHGYKPAAAGAYLQQMEARLRATPGVLSVSLVQLPPMGHTISRMDTKLNGHTLTIFPNWIEPGFLQTMNIPLLVGRDLQPDEKHSLIVSESLARRMWPGQNPLGKLFPSEETPGRQRDVVVGVAGNARLNAIQDTDATEAYWPAGVGDMPSMSVMVKTAGTLESLPAIARSIAETLDPRLFPEVRSIKALFQESVTQVERIAMIVSLIGLVALLLAAIGIVGLIAYTVTQRTKEIAIRLALGAERFQVMRAVLRQFTLPMLLGLLLGAATAAAASRVLRQVLFGVSNLDPLSYAGAIIVLLAIIAMAALLPIRRALRLDLAKILHYQ